MLSSIFKLLTITLSIPASLYIGLLGLLTTKWFQAQVVYLHAIQMTWFKDLDVPELFGFLHNQVTPFRIPCEGTPGLYAWHILPVELYRKHERELVAEPAGLVPDITDRLAFRLLRDDPEALLVVHLHGAAGTVGSGYRTPNYRALSAGSPSKIHVVTFDYRGFGRTEGFPSESGLIKDALAVVDWALNVAKIPPNRILVFAQSLGTAVNMAVAEHFVQQTPPLMFAGHILVAPFVDVATLVSTYRVAGTIPILGPLARFTAVMKYLRTFIVDTWLTNDRIVKYVRKAEADGSPYRITIIHAKDDYDIPWWHSTSLYERAVSAASPGANASQLMEAKLKSKQELGAAGSVVEWKTRHGVLREEILQYGLHDVIMGNPIVTMAVMRMFDPQE